MRSSLILLATLASYAVGLPRTSSLNDRSIDIDVDADIDIGALHADLDLDVFIGDILGLGSSHSPASLLTGLSAHAAAALQAGALGCNAGNIGKDAIADLKHWLNGAGAHLDASLKAHLLHWCNAGASATLDVDIIAGLSLLLPTCSEIAAKGNLFVTVGGIFQAAELEGVAVLTAGAQASLSSFLSGGIELDAQIKAALNLCAGGGVVTSLTADVKAALKAWLNGGNCTLDAGLKASVQAWLEGKIGGEVTTLGELSEGALSAVSVGSTILSLVTESGALVSGAQKSLTAFLHADVAADLEADIKSVLEACAKGELAASISAEVRTSLAIWLSGSSCTLGAELKAVVLFWLSFAVSVESTGLSLVGGLISDITGIIGTLGVGLDGVLSILTAGESLLTLSLKARAEIIAILGGCTSIELPTTCITIIIEWVTGCTLPGGGGSSPSSTPVISPSSSMPVSTPVSTVTPTPTSSVPVVTTPSGGSSSSVAPTSNVPEGPSSSAAPTSSVPQGPSSSAAPTSNVPQGPSSSAAPTSNVPQGPSSSVAPTSNVPEGPSSSAAPTSNVPQGPSSSAAPTSNVPEGSGSSNTGAGPAPTTSSVPCPSSGGEGANPVSSTPAVPTSSSAGAESSGAAESTPCPCESGEEATTSNAMTTPPAVTSAPATPSGSGPRTVTVTTTVSVASCQ